MNTTKWKVTPTLCTGKAWEWVTQSDQGCCIWPAFRDQSSDVPSLFSAPGWSADYYHPSPFPLESFLWASLHDEEFYSIAVITKTTGSVQFIPVSFLPVLLNLCFKWQKLFFKRELFHYSLFIPTSFSLIFSHFSPTKLFGQQIEPGLLLKHSPLIKCCHVWYHTADSCQGQLHALSLAAPTKLIGLGIIEGSALLWIVKSSAV